ncbi:MAG: hypothetical protein K0R00_219 [Herbinix sp.]|jgi:hypothetical protein|nr:hypothetical protein [Herbinix sp.]
MFDLDFVNKSLGLCDEPYMSNEDFHNRTEEILGSLFLRSNCVTKKDYRKHCDYIFKSYEINFKAVGGPPDIEDIILNIETDNWEKMLELGKLDLCYGQGKQGYLKFISYQDFEKDFMAEQAIEKLAEMWYTDYHFEDSDDMFEYVMKILNEHNLAYTYPESKLIEYRKGKREIVCFNDCQNLLLPEWQLHMIISRGGSHEYTADEIKALLSVSIISKD